MPASSSPHPHAPRRAATYYDILEVSSNASPEVIRAAYRSLMQRYHPDKNPGDSQAAARAARVVQAYETLSDASRRAAYDASLSEATAAHATASVAVGQAWMENLHAYQHAQTARTKSHASLILLLCVGLVVVAAGWAIIATLRHAASPRLAGSAATAPFSRAHRGNAAPSGRDAARALRSAEETPDTDNPEPASITLTGAPNGGAGREIPALFANLSIALRNPQSPDETTGYRLEIPSIAVRLGGKQTDSARGHLGSMTADIRKALEANLALADYDSLMMTDGETALARRILETIAQASGLPVCDGNGDGAGSGDAAQASEACYGLVAVGLPEAYVVK